MRITRSIVPNLFTLLNLFMGFTAIIHIAAGEYEKAALFVFAAAIFDTLDGMAARLLHSASELGAELDSLCDAVSFGVAPAFMLYKMYFEQYGELGILIASLPALAGVTRLARFNVQVTGFEDKQYFTGLPIPAGALTILSYSIFIHHLIPSDSFYQTATIIAVTLITAAAMISTVKYDNLPRPTPKYIKKKPIIFSIFIIGVIASIISKGQFIFPFMIFYIIVSSIRHLIIWFKESREVPEEFDESEELEPGHYDL